MKIERNKPISLKFGDIDGGSVFTQNDHVYMKLEGEINQGNAINLFSGCMVGFCDTEEIIPRPDATLYLN